MESVLDHINTTKQFIYKERAIWLGTFLGGPLVAGYLMAENFKVFDEEHKARTTWTYAIIAMVAILGIIFFIPGVEKIPSFVFPIVYAGVTNVLVQSHQHAKIEEHITNGGPVYSTWRAIGFGLIGAIIISLPILVVFIFTFQ